MSFCGECGTENPDTNRFCKNCGKALRQTEANAPAAPTAPQPATAPVQQAPAAAPVPPQAAAGPAPVKAPAAGESPKRSWLGIISLIPAIVSFLLYPYLLGTCAVLIGIGSIALARKQGTRFPVAGVIGIIIGLISIFMNMFWLDIFPPQHFLPPIE